MEECAWATPARRSIPVGAACFGAAVRLCPSPWSPSAVAAPGAISFAPFIPSIWIQELLRFGLCRHQNTVRSIGRAQGKLLLNGQATVWGPLCLCPPCVVAFFPQIPRPGGKRKAEKLVLAMLFRRLGDGRVARETWRSGCVERPVLLPCRLPSPPSLRAQDQKQIERNSKPETQLAVWWASHGLS